MSSFSSGKPYPWQAAQWQHIANLVARRTLPHALLLRGPAGTGKLHYALTLAQRMLCAAPVDGVACQSCKYCQLFAAGTHPDFCLVQPEEGSRAIKVEQVRDLIGFASRKAQFEGYRVVVLAPAEAMNVNASNALLKCLEEPGGNTLIMLVTHQVSQLLPTIRSRCQSIEFPVPEAAAVLPWLAQVLPGETDAPRMLALAGGCPVKALALASGDWQKHRDQTFAAWSAFLLRRASLVETAESLAKLTPVDVLEWLAGWYVDMARLQSGVEVTLTDADKAAVLRELSAGLSPARLFADYDQLMELRAAFMRGANFNPQMALEGLLGSLRS